MKQSKLALGAQVVVNDLDDATIYTVREIEGFRAGLTQTLADGSEALAGWIDIGYLQAPTKQQLLNKQKKA